MFNRVDSINIQPSSLSYPSEQIHQDKNKKIKQLSEDSTLTSEQQEKLAEVVSALIEEPISQKELELSSKEIVQIKDEIIQQNKIEIPSEEDILTKSSPEEIEEEDLFGAEETDDISDVGNKSESEALEDQISGMAEITTSNEISIDKEETTTLHTKEGISEISHSVDEVIHNDVEIDTELQEENTVLPSQTCAKMLQGVDRTVEKLKSQSTHHQTSIEEKEQSVKEPEGNQATLVLGIGLDAISINNRIKAVNGLLDASSVKKESQTTSDTIRASFADIVNTEADKMKFEGIVKSACIHFKKPVEASGYKVIDSIIIKVAQEELEQQVVEHGSVDLPEEKIKAFTDRFFDRAIKEGAVVGSNGQPVQPSPEEMKTWKTEFAESFISHLISENLIQQPIKDETELQEKEQEQATSKSELSPSARKDIKPINRETIVNVKETKSSTTQNQLEQFAMNVIQKKAEEARKEEAEILKRDLEIDRIKQKDAKDRIKQENNQATNIKTNNIKIDQLQKEKKLSEITKQQKNIKKSEKVRVSKNPEDPPIDFVDNTREKRPS